MIIPIKLKDNIGIKIDSLYLDAYSLKKYKNLYKDSKTQVNKDIKNLSERYKTTFVKDIKMLIISELLNKKEKEIYLKDL